MLILQQQPEFYIGGGDLTDCFYIQKKNAITRTLVLILSMGISRDTVVVEVADYSKPCPAVLGRQADNEGRCIYLNTYLTYHYHCISRKMHRFHRVINN
jgi:hypothetical protein